MPELPEVETLCRQLNTILPGERILRIEVLDPRLGNIVQNKGDAALIFPGSVPKGSGLEKIAGLVGRRVEAVTRRGKYIYMQMEGGLTAALHLRMSGRLLYRPAGKAGKSPGVVGHVEASAEAGIRENAAPVPFFNPLPSSGITGSCPPFSRLVITFSSGTLVLLDPRRFATFVVQPPVWSAPALPDDPMRGLPVRPLRELARTRRLPVKSFLMDQRLIAGIGNIYACEILFAAGIDPRRPACSLSATEWRKASEAAAAILSRAVDCHGTTMSDWRDLFGCSGTNQDHLEVYSRQGTPCGRCGVGIERIAQSGRGTWFCPSCQK